VAAYANDDIDERRARNAGCPCKHASAAEYFIRGAVFDEPENRLAERE
jgi:hypothetical protein